MPRRNKLLCLSLPDAIKNFYGDKSMPSIPKLAKQGCEESYKKH